MQEEEEGSLNPRNLVSSLKKCASTKNLELGCRIHATIVEKGLLGKDAFIASALVSMYAKCGIIARAREVLDKLPVRDVVSWTALIGGYLECGRPLEALNCFELMKQEDISPDVYAYASGLKACNALGDIEKGQVIHKEISRYGLEAHFLVGNTLVNMYSKSGLLLKAKEQFDKLEVRTVVSWTTLISGYLENGYPIEALHCLGQMQKEGLSPDATTYICSLKACACAGTIDKGQEIHVEISKKGLENDLLISTLVDMYSKIGSLFEAQHLFHKILDVDVVLWTSLIAGHVEHELSEEALQLFARMQHSSISPDSVTFAFVLKSCGSIRAQGKGQQIHAVIAAGEMKLGLLVGNCLVDMYVKCGSIAKAKETFDKLVVRDVASWTTLMTGFVDYHFYREAFVCFYQMQYDGVAPDDVAYSCVLKACEGLRALSEAEELHTEIIMKGFEEDIVVTSTLVGMYAKCRVFVKANAAFDSLQVRNVIVWNALIGGLVEHGLSEDALECFNKMQQEGVCPHVVTFLCVLKACGSLGGIELGEVIHSDIVKRGFEIDLIIGNTLVDLYAKCGLLLEARVVFENLPDLDVITWNSLLAGYSQIGEGEQVFSLLKRMVETGRKPDIITLVSVLNVCNHAGKVNEGHMFFEAMGTDYGIVPTPEHHTCLIDLLGRAGHVDHAILLIKEMPFHPGITPWHTVLGACRKWGNVELGKHAFQQAVGLNVDDVASYVSMANIFADAEMECS